MQRMAISFFFCLGAFSISPVVQAAPQILGVIASASPLRLHCDAGTCRTEVSTYCLQAERATPDRHHAYTAVDPSVFSVLAKAADGDTVRVPLMIAGIRSERGYTAAQIAFPDDFLRQRGLTPVALTVADGGVLVPTALVGDDDPIRTGEIETVVASLQPIAADVFKKHGKDYEAIRIVNRLINETPEHGRLASADRESLWQNTFGENPRESVNVGMRRAADVLGYCQYRTKQGRFFSVRRCLENRLDGMLMDINADYWRAVQPGS